MTLSEYDREFMKTQAKQFDYLFDLAAEWIETLPQHIQQTGDIQAILLTINGMRSINQRIVRKLKLDVLVSGDTEG